MKLTKLAACILPVLAGNGGVVLDISYQNADEIPEGFAGLYTEVDGVFKLTGVRGLKTGDDLAALQGALAKEKNDHKATKAKFRVFDGMELEDVLAKLDRIGELEAAAGGNLDDAAIDKIVETRIQSRLNPVQRELTEAKTLNEELSERVKGFETATKQRQIQDELSSVGRQMKVTEHAFDDMLVIGGMMFDVDEAGQVVTTKHAGMEGLSAQVWLTEQQKKRPHWFPVSQGGGALGGKGGSMGDNPFTHEGWNLTQQGALLKTDRALAEQMAKAAGTTIGGQRPPAKK